MGGDVSRKGRGILGRMRAWRVVAGGGGRRRAPYGLVMRDIATFEDCRTLVDQFYGAVRQDDKLGPIFESRVESWDHHLDTMARFWFTALFSKPSYRGNPLVKHMDLPVDRSHFERWLGLWGQTVDATFEGKRATRAKNQADLVARTFQMRMGLAPKLRSLL